jgi:hypothetical protein
LVHARFGQEEPDGVYGGSTALGTFWCHCIAPDHVSVHPGFVEDTTPLNEQQIDVQVQQEVNLRRGADLLLARKDVDPKRLAYVDHNCDASAGGFLSGLDERFKAFVIMAGDISFKVDRKTKVFGDYRQKVGPERFDAFTENTFGKTKEIYLSRRTGCRVSPVRDK